MDYNWSRWMSVESNRLLKQDRPSWPGSRICACHGSRRRITTDQCEWRWSPVDCLNNTGLLGQGVEDGVFLIEEVCGSVQLLQNQGCQIKIDFLVYSWKFRKHYFWGKKSFFHKAHWKTDRKKRDNHRKRILKGHEINNYIYLSCIVYVYVINA